MRDANDVAGAGKREARSVSESVVDHAPQGRDRVEPAAVAAARRQDPGFPADPLLPRLPQVGERPDRGVVERVLLGGIEAVAGPVPKEAM
jgi:hypothetical protein